jgi:hypothetical protein
MLSSATSGGILDRAIEAEDKKHGDFLRLVRLLFPNLLLRCPTCSFLKKNYLVYSGKEKSKTMSSHICAAMIRAGPC